MKSYFTIETETSLKTDFQFNFYTQKGITSEPITRRKASFFIKKLPTYEFVDRAILLKNYPFIQKISE